MRSRARSTTLDLRLTLLGFVLNVAAVPLFHQTSEIVWLVVLSAVYLLLERYYRRVIILFIQFAVFYALTSVGANIVAQNPASFIGMQLTMIGVMVQRVIPLLGYVYILTRISSGEFMSVLMRLHVPKAVAIGIASLFRFIPALGQTFSALRRASLFRGDGFRLKSILLHPARSIQYYLLPFLSRLTSVADDLAAALSTRGVGMGGTATCVRDLRAKLRDFVALLVLICVYGTLLLRRYL